MASSDSPAVKAAAADHARQLNIGGNNFGPVYMAEYAPARRKVPADNTLPLPAHFEPRQELFEAAKGALLDRGGSGTARKIGLVGMGGAGKSVLARALALDLQVRRTFRDGIRWVYLSEQADPHARLIELAGAFGDNRLAADSQHRLSNLNELLARASCLVILDDVWNIDQLREFELTGPKSALLITTRNQNILDRSVTIREVKTLPAESAHRLLAACAEQDASRPFQEAAQEVERQCDGLPLALAVAGGMIADRFSWEHLRDSLREAELREFEFVLPNYGQYRNLYRVLDASVSCLAEEKQERYLELAVFEDRGQVPDKVAARLWHKAGVSTREGERLIFQLSRRSLVQRSQPGSFTMHSLQFLYIRDRLGDDERVRELHGRLADTILGGWGGLDQELSGLWTSHPEEPAGRYGVLNLPGHLVAAGRHRDIHDLLALDRTTAAVAGHHPGQVENTWYAVHERIGEIAAYSADVRLAWNLAKSAVDRALPPAGPAPGIGLEVRYALLSASIFSITSSIPPELIVALVADGHWAAREGFEHARSLPTAQARARSLTGLLALPGCAADPAQAGEMAAEAAVAAHAIDEPGSRASALIALAACAPEPGRPEAIADAWKAVRSIRREYPMAEACVTLARAVRLPKGLLEETRTLAEKSRDPASKALILTALMPYLRGAERSSAADQAWQAAEAMPAGLAQARAFIRLAGQRAKSARRAELDCAQVAIGAISQPEDRAAALTALLPMVSAQTTAEKDVLAEIDMIGPPEAAVTSLIALISKVRAPRRPDLIGQALDYTVQMEQAEAKADALIALTGLAPADSESGNLQEKTASAIRQLSQAAARAVAYTTLARHQEAEFRSATIALALAEACAIDDAGPRAAGIAALVPHLPWKGSSEAELDGRHAADRAIQDARASGRRTLKIITLAAVAPALPEADRAAILKEASLDAYQVRDPVDRAAVFTALLPSMAGADRSGALDQACGAADDVADHDLRCAALRSLMGGAPDALGHQAGRAARRAERVHGRSAELNTALVACGLAPEECQRIASAILADPALALETDPPSILPGPTSSAKREAVHRSAAAVISALGAFRSSATALAIMTAVSADRPRGISGGPDPARAIARAWSAASALSSLTELPETLDDELREALRSVDEAHSRITGEPARPGAAREADPASPAGPFPPWQPYWRAVMDAAVLRGRSAVISELSALGAPMAHFGGNSAVAESIEALFDVGRWWP